MCVLLVEDEMLIRTLLMDALSEHGFQVVEATSGDEALALLQRSEEEHGGYRLLVSDINLPGGRDGFGVASAFRARYPDVPIVFVTGRPYALGDFPAHGPRDVLPMKPFRPSDLIQLAETLTVP